MVDNRLLADLARTGGTRLLDAAIDTLLPLDAQKLAPERKTLLRAVTGTVALRIATRSVPGAILVGGALIAKRLYDRRHRAGAQKSDRRA